MLFGRSLFSSVVSAARDLTRPALAGPPSTAALEPKPVLRLKDFPGYDPEGHPIWWQCLLAT